MTDTHRTSLYALLVNTVGKARASTTGKETPKIHTTSSSAKYLITLAAGCQRERGVHLLLLL